jgi:site-specific recombinase XerD
MGEILLSELIVRTEEAIRPLEHSQTTLYQYQFGWRELSKFFIEQDQELFSKLLAEQYVHETKAKLDAGAIKKWRYKLIRRTARMLIGCYEDGYFTWKYYKDDPSASLHQAAYVLLLNDYLNCLRKEGKGDRTIQTYAIVSRQFLEYLEQKKVEDISEVRLTDVSLFIPFISKQYQPTSMRTVLSALRLFLRFVENKNLTEFSLSSAIPSSFGRKTEIVPTITSEEEQKLLLAADCTTTLGKRNYAMLLLALRTGLRSTDIVNLKLSDIHWKRNTIEIVQEKTDTSLVLPLLAEIGNAIADYILNGRPDSQLPYLFLRSQAPYRKLSGRSACYGICCKMMKEAGIRQSKQDRKGFHCLRHSVAARLLMEETPLPVISSILGHRNKDSTKIYLSTDLVHLRACGLSLKGIEVTKEELL